MIYMENEGLIDWGNGKKLTCNSYWNDDTSFALDVGDGELIDQDGDRYFIHCECNNYNNFIFEICFESEVCNIFDFKKSVRDSYLTASEMEELRGLLDNLSNDNISKSQIQTMSWQAECDLSHPYKAMTVQIGFSHKENDNDETEFCINAWDKKELAALFEIFCEENHFEDVSINDISIVKVASSLDKLTYLEEIEAGLEVHPEITKLQASPEIKERLDAFLNNKTKSNFSAEKEVYVKRKGVEPCVIVPFITVTQGDVYFVGGDEYVAKKDAHYACSREQNDPIEDVAFLDGWAPEDVDGPWYDDYEKFEYEEIAMSLTDKITAAKEQQTKTTRQSETVKVKGFERD